MRVICTKGHDRTCDQCAENEFRLIANTNGFDARCNGSGYGHHIKTVGLSDQTRRESRNKPSKTEKQFIATRDEVCRFCGFEPLRQRSIVAPGEKSRLDAFRHQAKYRQALRLKGPTDTDQPTLFGTTVMAASIDEMSRYFYDLRDPAAEAAYFAGHRMMEFDHILGVQFVAPIRKYLLDPELDFLGKKAIVWACNECNRRRKERLESEPRLIEIYTKVFLCDYNTIPDDAYENFKTFIKAVRLAHEHLARTKLTEKA